MTTFRTLSGLPPYGPLATSFPARFSGTGREGYVVEFLPDTTEAWVGNFAPGMGGYSGVHLHPNNTDILVFSAGSGYVVDVHRRNLKEELSGEFASVWEVHNPQGLVCNRQGLAFLRIGPLGIIWHSCRISLDGFQELAVGPHRITGLAYDLDGSWTPFEVDLASGSTTGAGSAKALSPGWEKLAL